MGVKGENRIVFLVDKNIFINFEYGFKDLFKKISSYAKVKFETIKCEQAVTGLGVPPISTKHIRQFAAIDNFS